MTTDLAVQFDRRPSVLRFMLNAVRQSGRKHEALAFPPIVARWRHHRVERRQLAQFCELTGLGDGTNLPMIYPHVFGFRLQMVVLTHPAFPIPIWKALQVRNHLLQHRAIPAEARLDLETRVADHRILEKGTEVDLHTTVSIDGQLVWESLNAFYYRGRAGAVSSTSLLPKPPPIPAVTNARWHLPPGVGWRLARMTGDYNGIHHWHWYARRFGFQGAFFHPQLIVGQCMAHLRGLSSEQPQQLRVWLRGAVYFGAGVSLRAENTKEDCAFALMVQGEERPAILGRWGPAPVSGGLSR